MARLGDLCRFINGDRGKNYPSQADIRANGEIPFINAGHLVDGKIDFSEMNYISQKKFEQLNSGKIQENDILYCLRGSLGKKAIVKGIHKGAIASSLVIIRPDAQKLNSDYLFYALESPAVQEQMMQANNGSSQPNLSAKSVSDYTFNLPGINDQLGIVSKLTKVNELIALRKEQLAKLDQLVKSQFIELFGERLEKETVKLSTLTEVITKGTTPTTLGFEFSESGVNFVKIECITEDGKFIVPKMLHISDECNQKLKRSILQEGDVLFSIAGAIGRTAIVTKEILPANTNQAVAIIRLQKDCGLNVKFLNQMLHSSLIEKQVNVKKAGVAQINLSLTDIGDFNIVVPPMEEQEQFAAFVEQTDKSKLAIQQSLNKLETLKKSLMQEYFG